MPVASTRSVALNGIDGHVIEVEADVSQNLPGFVLIGLPDTSLGEAKERVRLAASNSGCALTDRKLTVNLSPAALPKHGSGFDLAIAIASLAAAGQVPGESISGVVHLGELRLDGRLRPAVGVLPAVLAAKRAGMRTVMVPHENQAEAELVVGMRVVGVRTLRDAANWHGASVPEPATVRTTAVSEPDAMPQPSKSEQETAQEDGDLSDVVGNAEAIEALIVAAAGGHNLWMLGPPGSGKTMLARRLRGILPDLTPESALEVSCIRSLSGSAPRGSLEHRPPFESPHHTATAAALLGGGSTIIRPGAAAKAAHGVLFLDEAPEFSPTVLDSLRQPLESGLITIHRARATATFPGNFQLVLAANPCPCGNYGVRDGDCACPVAQRRRYLARISGPLRDRIDIQLAVQRITAAQLRLADELPRIHSVDARARIQRARTLAAARLRDTPWQRNAQVAGAWLRHPDNRPTRQEIALLDDALERGLITMRGFDRVLRLAWSLADLEQVPSPNRQHISQALYLRRGVAG